MVDKIFEGNAVLASARRNIRLGKYEKKVDCLRQEARDFSRVRFTTKKNV